MSGSVPLIARRLLFGPAERASPALSPDGATLAFLAPVAGVAGVHVGPPGGPYTAMTGGGGSVATFCWCKHRHRL